MCNLFQNQNPIGGYYPTTQNTSSSSTGTSSGTTTKSADPLAALGYTQTLQNAMGIASTPFEPYQGQMVAGFTPSQVAAQQGFQNAIGGTSPYYTASQNLYNQVPQYFNNPSMGAAQSYYSQGANAANNPNLGYSQGLYNASLNYSSNPLLPTAQNMYNQSINYADPNAYNEGSLSRYMNPYQQQVVDATMGQLKQVQNEMLGQNTQNSVLRGTYGGSGQFMGKSQIARQQALANAQALGALNTQNFQNAQNQYNQQQGTAIGANQAAANALGQLGYQQQATNIQALQNAAQGTGALGYQNAALQSQALQNAGQGMGALGAQQQGQAMQGALAAAQGMQNLGTQQQQAQLQALAALNASGQQQQALQQQQLTNAYQQWQQAKAYPYQQAAFFSGLASGLGPLLGGSASTNTNMSQSGSGASIGMQPYANQQGAGGGMGLLSAGLGALLSPFGVKRGGRVTGRKHFAFGGTDGDGQDDESQDTSSVPDAKSFGSVMYQQPYSANIGVGAQPQETFGSLAMQQPYSSGSRGSYITDALKMAKVIPNARDVAVEELTNEIQRALGKIPNAPNPRQPASEITESFFGSPDTSGVAPGDSESPSHHRSSRDEDSDDKKGGFLDSLWDDVSEPGTKSEKDDVTEILRSNGESLAHGGRAYRAEGGAANPKMAAPEAAGYVTDLYNQDLSRKGDQGGFDFWTNQLQSGNANAEQVRQGFLNSQEYAANQQAKNAPPPPPPNYTDISNPYASRTIGDIMNSQQSANFNAQMNPYGNNSATFGDLMKQAYANSPGPQWSPEQQGMPAMPDQSYYQKNLPIYSMSGPLVQYPSGLTANGSGPGVNSYVQNRALSGTMNGGASNTDYVNALYRNYLGREASPEEMTQRLQYLEGTQGSRADMEAQFLSNPEAVNSQYVNNLYAKIFGREPDAEGKAFWQNALAGGMSAADVQRSFLKSPERQATSVVQGYYPTIQDTRINPYTGLANLKYTAPYKSKPTPYAPDFFAKGGRVKRRRGGQLSLGEIAAAALEAGATPKEAAMLTSIAVPESARNAYAHNPNARTGDNSYGLWQINMLGGMGPERRRQFGLSSNEQLYDPVTNARAALKLLHGRGGLGNWTTYTAGKNRPYYSAAVQAVNSAVKDPKSMLAHVEPLDIHAGGEPNRDSVMYGAPPKAATASAEVPEQEAPRKPGLSEVLDKIAESGDNSGGGQELAKAPPPVELPQMDMPSGAPDLALLGDLGGGASDRYLDRYLDRNESLKRAS